MGTPVLLAITTNVENVSDPVHFPPLMKDMINGLFRPQTIGEHVTAFGLGGNIGLAATATMLVLLREAYGVNVLSRDSIETFRNFLLFTTLSLCLIQATGLIRMNYLEKENWLRGKS